MTGILILDKPSGFTSFDAVAKTRKIFGEKKCGHSGTLDPMATGVLTVLLGGATRFCELLPDHNKAYSAVMKLGTETDTLDITGKIISEKKVSVGANEVFECAKGFTGEIIQVPPMYSAVSVNGKRLYELARAGVEAERPERRVTIYSLDIEKHPDNENEYILNVECSSGTYIRTLISDIGSSLGCGAVLTSLRRTRANGFTLKDSYTPDYLSALSENGSVEELESLLIPVDRACSAYPGLTVSAAQSVRFSNGGDLMRERLSGCAENGIYRVYSPDGRFLGLGETDGGDLKVKRVYIPK